MAGLSGGAALLSSLTVFGLVTTKLVDSARNIFDKDGVLTGSWIWNVLALGLGVGMGLVGQINVFAGASGSNVSGWPGEVLTGLGVGAAGSAWHEVLDTLSSAAKKLNPP